MPAVNDNDTYAAVNATKRYLVSPEKIAYVKWLVYSGSSSGAPQTKPRGLKQPQSLLQNISSLPAKVFV